MKVHTFMGKVNIEGLHQMDHQINNWLLDHDVEIKEVRQCYALHKHHDGRREEPVIVSTLWYEEKT
ncbi:MAG: hypothetical protein ACLFTT_12275 [Candidatus Hydrogenedentota bacterium]